MSFNDYKKTAVNLLANLSEKDDIVSFSSSCGELLLLPYVKEIARAVMGLGRSVSILDARCTEDGALKIISADEQEGEAPVFTVGASPNGKEIGDAEVLQITSSAKQASDLLFVVTNSVTNDVAALFASKAKAAVLVEKKKKSRTDRIEAELTELNILKVEPKGFVLL